MRSFGSPPFHGAPDPEPDPLPTGSAVEGPQSRPASLALAPEDDVELEVAEALPARISSHTARSSPA